MRESIFQRIGDEPERPRNAKVAVPVSALDITRRERDGADRVATALRVVAALGIIIGVLYALVGVAEGEPLSAAIGFSSIISGLLFLAAAAGLRLLVGISWLIETQRTQAPSRPAPMGV